MSSEPRGLRQRKKPDLNGNPEQGLQDGEDKSKIDVERVMGKTPSGVVFRIPKTHNVLSGLFDPRLPKSHVDIITLFLLFSQAALFFFLPTWIARPFFGIYFAFWRLSYNVGLGIVLRKQSEDKWIVRSAARKGYFDPQRRPKEAAFIRSELEAKMGPDYDFNAVPLEFNVWIFFRHLVDIVLLNDFTAYLFFGCTYLSFPGPAGHSVWFHLVRWIGALALLVFNIWVKVDAHRIIKDFAWYWGDAFFMSMDTLVFDGVFEFAPHPMYSVGYAAYYGMSLATGSNTVLVASIIAHALQFYFLWYFENPHIERTYGERKPIAARTPLEPMVRSERSGSASSSTLVQNTTFDDFSAQSTDCEDTEVEEEQVRARYQSSTVEIQRVRTRHDLDNKYFSKDMFLVGMIKNFDPFRASDLSFILITVYALAMLLPPLQPSYKTALLFAHTLAWRIFHSIVIGLILKKQGEQKWLVRHFLKHYHYDHAGGAAEQAWQEWKRVYGLSLGMTYLSFGTLAWHCYTLPSDWNVGGQIVRHTIGLFLVGFHVWIAQSTFEILGPFGYFYGDFFIQDYPTQLYYTGIFRFLNNPERSMGGAAFFGLVLIVGSKLLLVQAVIAVLAHWWFLSAVEGPHMKRLYGSAIRKEAGVTKTLKNVAKKNKVVFDNVSRGVKEVQGTFEKVLEETGDAVEEFLKRSKPKIQNYVNDTRIKLKQTGEKFVISRVANDIEQFNRDDYSLQIQQSTYHKTASSKTHIPLNPEAQQYHLGEPIYVDWKAPVNHSENDWVGLYRIDANGSKLVTTVGSLGRWVGVHSDEEIDDKEKNGFALRNHGTVRFDGKKLFWAKGVYEFRYHHDGKHNAMAVSDSIEIFVDTAENPDDPKEVFNVLTGIISCVLGFQPAVAAVSVLEPPTIEELTKNLSVEPVEPSQVDGAKTPTPSTSNTLSSHELNAKLTKSLASSTSSIPNHRSTASVDRDKDRSENLKPHIHLSEPYDFPLYSTDEAEHISYAIKEAFDVDLAPEVVIAAANVQVLMRRVEEARTVLGFHMP